MTHLDTSYLVDLLREAARGVKGPATARLESLADEELGVSVHVLCELHAGAELSRAPEVERARVESLSRPLAHSYPDEQFPAEYGRQLAELRRRGETISTMDLLIATAALVDGAALVTRNARDFERVPGLRVLAY
ncbi:MAG: type II toxin-antitoxin system VapC family toxin [Gemmatimonadota bacterium]|nr:type II toxin-antitoxin system VapC family toxin [Gemmatimonadota bacterium]